MTDDYIKNIMLDGALVSKLRADIEDLFAVDTVEIPRHIKKNSSLLAKIFRKNSPEKTEQGVIYFVGELLSQDNEAVYDTIAERWQAHSYTPMMFHHKGQVAVAAQPGITVSKPTNPWINLALAIITIFSVMLSGASYECQCAFPTTLSEWLGGLPMMLTLLGILTAHEFGHYFAARYYKLAVTLPYFLPLPFISPVGTMGAFIQLQAPFKTKKELFDIGVAGPLAGLILAVPMIFIGIATSPVRMITREPNSILEGNSIFYLAVKYIMHGKLLPNFDAYTNLPAWQEFLKMLFGVIPAGGGEDIFISSVAWAAWFGLLVTAINLLPIGQLDGGHIVYCLLGEKKARLLGITLIATVVFAGIFLSSSWIALALLIVLVIGPNHPPPLNNLTELGTPRKLLAYFMIIVFILLFTPAPLQFM